MKLRDRLLGGALAAATMLTPGTGMASSHREAPFITKNPKVDGTDFYMFNSYEGAARDGYVTLIANYLPLQDSYGGPNYFTLDPEALYEIHIDNTGDGIEDITFQFDFDLNLTNNGTGVELPIGGKNINIPLAVAGSLSSPTDADQNMIETYKLGVVRGPRRGSAATSVTNLADNSTTFHKPYDNAGGKTIANYASYANQFIYEFDMPGCTPTGVQAGTHSRVFVGQRREGFAVNLGQVFDLVNMGVSALGVTPANGQADLTGAADQGKNIVGNKNITSLAIEVPASCLERDASSPIIAGWTTASVRQARVINPTATFKTPAREGGPWVQVSRLGMVLVNEIVIGIKDKDKFNGSEPKDDGQFADYVTNPSLPILVEVVFGATGALAPTTYPRADLVAAFLNGVPSVNVMSPTLFEAVRLNTAVPATSRANQNALGAATCFDPPANNTVGPTLNLARTGCDPAGFPNGRRPGDDTVDIALRVAMGFLLDQNHAPIRGAPLVDGAKVDARDFLAAFPYLNTPAAGAP
ncbi:MAG: DUF4331 domain-containing protein [Kofleriaceae bacterium]|nr:DUF4331 domain-containing protein [Kofleriaceae bacterium]